MLNEVFSSFKIGVSFGRSSFRLGAIWLVVIPASIWIIGVIYVPILGAPLDRLQTWEATALTASLVLLSLAAHAYAHLSAARLFRSRLPESLPLYPTGDAAQAWPPAASSWREFLVALAGPLVNLALAGLAYLVWNAQLDPILNVSMPFWGLFSLWLAVVNLTPAYPFDGGRLLRAFLWAWSGHAEGWSRLLKSLGYAAAGLSALWGFFLIYQHLRFSLDTGLITLLFSGLILLILGMQPGWESNFPAPERSPGFQRRILLAPIGVLLILAAAGSSLALALTNDGMEAPGVAIPVGPMVEVPAKYNHPYPGSLVLTTVIPQAPIMAWEWALGQLTPAIHIMPPQQILPANTSYQQIARQGDQMLNQSEIVAVAEGMRLAGYDVKSVGKGAKVLSVLPQSHASGILMPGDVIVGLDGASVQTDADLIAQVQKLTSPVTVHLVVQRDGKQMNLDVPLMPPDRPGGHPLIGITVDSAGVDVKLPFPVSIKTQKIAGGPSAGLMFTLGVYNALTPGDITGGRVIAGTGTINLDGSVGPIGGVQQKVVAAELAGAGYFLVPPGNYADALAAAHGIQVVKISTASQAVQFLKSLP
jgi:PDZ domain-containing protein